MNASYKSPVDQKKEKLINGVLATVEKYYPNATTEEQLIVAEEIISHNFEKCLQKHATGESWKLE